MGKTPREWPRFIEPEEDVLKVQHIDGAQTIWTRMSGGGGSYWSAPGWENGVDWAQVLRWGAVREIVE